MAHRSALSDLRSDNISLRLGPPALARETVASLLKMTESEFNEDDGRSISQPLLMQTIYDEEDIFVKVTDFGNGEPIAFFITCEYSYSA